MLWLTGQIALASTILLWVTLTYSAASVFNLGDKRTAVGFACKHGVGLLMVAGVWLAAYHQWQAAHTLLSDIFSLDVLLTILGFIAVTRPASYFISRVMGQWTLQVANGEGSSLTSGGTAIGYLERILILLLIQVDQWEAIGFLLAAKGILRFNELTQKDHRSSSEYVVLGTLLSFLLAIGIGIAIKRIPELINAAPTAINLIGPR